jgi:hypothetical protein
VLQLGDLMTVAAEPFRDDSSHLGIVLGQYDAKLAVRAQLDWGRWLAHRVSSRLSKSNRCAGYGSPVER